MNKWFRIVLVLFAVGIVFFIVYHGPNVGEPVQEGETKPPVSQDGFYGLYATYVGQIDNNFIEMIADPTFGFPASDKACSFKLGEQVKEYFDPNSSVYIEFTKYDIVRFDCVKTEQGQWEIIKLENTTATEPKLGPVEGEYVGQIDANSIEVRINGQPRAFRVGENIKNMIETSGFKTGSLVEIRYIKPKVGQEEIISLSVMKELNTLQSTDKNK